MDEFLGEINVEITNKSMILPPSFMFNVRTYVPM